MLSCNARTTSNLSLLCTENDSVSESMCFTGIHNINILLRLLLSPRGLVISHTCTRQGQAQETSRLLDVRGKIMDHLAVDAVQRPVTVPVERIEHLHHSYCIRLLPTQIRSSSHPSAPSSISHARGVAVDDFLQPYLQNIPIDLSNLLQPHWQHHPPAM